MLHVHYYSKPNNTQKLVCVEQTFVLRVFALRRFFCIPLFLISNYVCYQCPMLCLSNVVVYIPSCLLLFVLSVSHVVVCLTMLCLSKCCCLYSIICIIVCVLSYCPTYCVVVYSLSPKCLLFNGLVVCCLIMLIVVSSQCCLLSHHVDCCLITIKFCSFSHHIVVCCDITDINSISNWIL